MNTKKPRHLLIMTRLFRLSQFASLSQVFNQAQLISLAANKAVFDVIDESTNNMKPQTAVALCIQIFINRHTGHFVNRKVDRRIVQHRDFKAVGKRFDNDFDLIAQRLRQVSVLDNVGAGFANSHLDFSDIFGPQSQLFCGFNDKGANVRQRIRRAGKLQVCDTLRRRTPCKIAGIFLGHSEYSAFQFMLEAT